MSKNQLVIPKGLSRSDLKKAIFKQQDKVLVLFEPLLAEIEQAEKEFVTTDKHVQREFETTMAFGRKVPQQALRIVYEWVRMDYATVAPRTCVRIQFKGSLYEIPVQFVNKD